MRFGSLFTGIGGLDLGLERVGMQCAWQVERDDFATRVLERHWPGVRRWRDVREFIADAKSIRRGQLQGRSKEFEGRSSEWFTVDLIAGGFPCQPVSVAGSRKGDGDERWLWNEFAECIRILQPRWVIAENVPGLLSAANGRLFRGILFDLFQMGFDAEWVTLPAAAFGAPHLRERVFIVASHSKHNGPFAGRGEPGKPKDKRRLQKPERHPVVSGDWRTVEPVIRRGDHGVSARVDRLRCLGNAVVPQVAEYLGRRIMEFEGVK